MLLLITGSREVKGGMLAYATRLVERAHARGDVHIMVGDAPGIDAHVIAKCDELSVPVTVVGAYGKLRNSTKIGENKTLNVAYTLRDQCMARECDMCIGVHNGYSRGTSKTLEYAKRIGKKTHLYSEPI